MNILDKINEKQLKPDVPEFRVGDTVKVGVKVIEGKKERIQVFEGLVMKRCGSKVAETFTVLKKSAGVGVERTFPVHSPKVAYIEVVKKGKVRRAKLNYVKDIVGQIKIKERN